MYVDYEKWENLKDDLKNINSNYNYAIVQDILNNLDDQLKEIEKTESSKAYVVTSKTFFNSESDCEWVGIAFTKSDAKDLFNKALKKIKTETGMDVPTYIDEEHKSFQINFEDANDNLHIFSAEIKEFDISKNLNKEMEIDL